MKALVDLIVNDEADAWHQVVSWLATSPHPVEVLDGLRPDAEATLLAAQVTTRSALGAVAWHCGGILIDRGWLRILGAGSDRIGGGLRRWNENLGGPPLTPPVGAALLVAYDALGGWFAINGGRWPGGLGEVRYLAPDGTGWQSLGLGYLGFLEWSMSPSFGQFYAGDRWPSWEVEVSALGPDEAIAIYPPLGFEETPPACRSRSPVPLQELWQFHHELARQLEDVPPGSSFEFGLTQ